MNFKNLYILLALLFSCYIFLGHSAGRADSQSWGNTGAPGDETLSNGSSRTCITCHGGSAIAVDLDIDILNTDGSPLENNTYIPGSTYNMSVTISATTGNPAEYGFQMLALTDSDEQEVNTWANPSANTEIAFASNTGRTYVEQSVPSSSNTFTMDWTAPESGKGDVTFYSCGNGVNGNGSTSGDGANCSTLTLTEAQSNAVVKLNRAALQLALSPNPATDLLQVEIDTQLNDDFQLNILNMNGQLIRTQRWPSTTSDKVNLDVSELTSGMYFIQLTNKAYSSTSKWIKL